MNEIDAVIGLLNKGGTTALLVMVLLGGFRQWWVFGWHYTEVKKDRDEWKSLALQGNKLLDRAVTVVTQQQPTT